MTVKNAATFLRKIIKDIRGHCQNAELYDFLLTVASVLEENERTEWHVITGKDEDLPKKSIEVIACDRANSYYVLLYNADKRHFEGDELFYRPEKFAAWAEIKQFKAVNTKEEIDDE